MAEVVGVKNIKEVVVAGAKIYGTIAEAKRNDGKIDLKDVFLLMPLIQPVSDAVADINQVIPEFKDLSVAEAGELTAAVMAELGMVEEKAKMQIEKVLLALKANYEAVKAFA